MKVKVASINPTKIKAVEEVLNYYYERNGGSLKVFDGVDDFNRKISLWSRGIGPFYENEDHLRIITESEARECYSEEYLFSVAIEEGFVPFASGVVSRYFYTQCAVVYNGKKVIGVGFGQKIEPPKRFIDRLKELKILITDTSKLDELQKKANIEFLLHEETGISGSNRTFGMIGLLLDNYQDRLNYIKGTVACAVAPRFSRPYRDKEINKK